MKLLIVLLLSLSVMAQTITEKLPDGTYIVQIEGIEYRALPPQKVKKILEYKNDAKTFKEYSKQLQDEVNNLRGLLKTQDAMTEDKIKLSTDNLKNQIVFWQSEYNKEKSLRVKYESNLKRCINFGFKVCWF